MHQFAIGKTYSTRSVCNYDCIFSITVSKRTAKTLTTTDGKILRIKIDREFEYVMPEGRYSMAPVISARIVSVAREDEGVLHGI